LFDEDFNLIAPNDVLYIALQGENFNYCAILDDYDLGRTLGIGGFGKVILAKHKETKWAKSCLIFFGIAPCNLKKSTLTHIRVIS
jgi:serine/threonine protein kinase